MVAPKKPHLKGEEDIVRGDALSCTGSAAAFDYPVNSLITFYQPFDAADCLFRVVRVVFRTRNQRSFYYQSWRTRFYRK